jgi:SAM-dependent methyltransferase
MQREVDTDEVAAPTPSGPSRDLRTRDFATPDVEPATVFGGSEDETDPLPNRRYTSILFWRMVRGLDPQRPPARILDLGPTSHANMSFWAERGFKITCYDLEKHELEELEREPISNLTLAADRINQRRLPFDDGAFSAICAWNSFARLPFMAARRYIRECNRVLRPQGILHAIFLDAEGRLDTRRQYRIADKQQLDVVSGASRRGIKASSVEAELAFLFSSFDACETKAAPCQTRELLAQRRR